MKKVLSLLLVLLLVACSTGKKDVVVVKGKVDGLSSTEVKVYSGRDEVAVFNLKEDGTFNQELKLSDVAYYTLRLDRNTVYMYLQPGAEINVNCDFTDGKKEVKFSGSLAKENEYLIEKTKNARGINWRNLFALEENVFAGKMDSILTSQKDFFKKYKHDNKIDAAFANLESADLLYSAASMAGMYEGYHGYLTGNREFKVSENFNDYSDGLKINQDDLIALASYTEYLSKYLSDKVSEVVGKDEEDEKVYFDAKVKVVKDEFTAPKIKEAFFYKLATESIESFGVSKSKEFLTEAKTMIKDASKLELIDKKAVKYAKTDVGAVAPDFTLTNLKGEEVTLSSLKGKVVVVDFWATWCGPCKSSFPGMQKAVDKFKDVEFLFVNTWERVADKKANAEKFMADNKYNMNVLLDLDNKVVGDYNVSGIPTKYLIDKEGKIKDKKVGSGSDVDEIVEEIKKWVSTAE